jgi:glycosyltransferase involved in cell wall biosynthesis
MTKKDKLVSVVIPAYNASNTIIKALDSVCNQTYKNIEIIVVNDGSKDDTLTIITEYKEEKKGLNFTIIDKVNGGVSSARNVGIKLAQGNWIAFLDSDDEWLPNKLERQLEILNQNPQIDFLGTNRNREYFHKILWKKFGLLTKISPKLLMVKFIFVVPTIIFKKSITSTVGFFDETQKYAEEGNYFIRIAQKFNCYLLNESLVITGGGKDHFGHSGLSGNLKEMEKGELKNLNDAYRLGIINFVEFSCLNIFSVLKYIRRIIIVKLRSKR